MFDVTPVTPVTLFSTDYDNNAFVTDITDNDTIDSDTLSYNLQYDDVHATTNTPVKKWYSRFKCW